MSSRRPQPQPRPRPRTRQRGVAQTQTQIQDNAGTADTDENNAGRKLGIIDPDVSLELAGADVLGTSTPVRLPPPSRRRTERKPIQRRDVPSTLPPSSPPFAASPRREDPVQEPSAPMAKEDPFGLLAAERRLKARRDFEQIGKPKKRAPKEPESEDGRAAMPEAEADEEPEFELDLSTFVSGTHTPPGHTPDPRAATPRHHRPKQRKIPSTPPSQEDDFFPIPQTPSPTKRVSTGLESVPRRPFADVAHLDNSPAKTSTPAPAKGKGKKRSVKAGDGPARKKGKSDETLAEEELKGMTEELKELLPSRPKRRAATQRKSVVPVASKAKKSAGPGKARKGNAKTGASAKGKRAEEEEGESIVLRGGEREKYENDREGRKEYFKEVDEYVMHEEGVYII